jgi:inosine/guanosine/xanthosine phosphorylase family protein
MHEERERILGVVEALRARFGEAPEAWITLGSGLGPVVGRARVLARAPAVSLGLPVSTVPGHAGEAVLGDLGGVRVLFLSGRVHPYEGYPMADVVRYVRAAHAWGVPRLFLTCSAGSTHAGLAPGDLVLFRDHLNLMGTSPLVGPLVSGVRFPDASRAHDPALASALRGAASRRGVSLHEGVYAALLGPAYETAAEVRMVRLLGGDLVGMSTVPELLTACSLGLPAAAIAVVSNFGSGVGTGDVDHAAVTQVAGLAAEGLADVFEAAAEAGFGP